jgi:DNA-binding Lrp family transcriptional regulator
LLAFEEFVRGEPLVRECWMLSGEIDFILKCVAPDLKTFQAFVEKLTAAPHVRNVKTSLTLHNTKDAAMVPLELGSAR